MPTSIAAWSPNARVEVTPAPTSWPVTEGAPEPLGVTLTPSGINVAVWSLNAEVIELCLFDDAGSEEIARLALPGRTGPVFHGHVAGIGVGTRYGLRAHGSFDPSRGQRFNAGKLLVDPYALSLDRPFVLHPAMLGSPVDGLDFDETDSAAPTPKAVIVDPPVPTAPPPAPIAWNRTVILELNVRGFTRLHPDIPEALRGTFAGLAHPAALAHLKRLGVTSVELLPCQAWIDERHLPPLGLTNAWGYNPIAWLAPDPRLAPGGWAEVRAAVDTLAAAGIETILDVVFNHSGEGDALGPTLSLRGLDNAAYYRLDPNDPAGYLNDAGTGNTLNLHAGPALRLTMDALRAWRRLGGVAGFRFDLATVMGRGPDGFDPAAPLLAAIDQDPELRELKLIAEPWDTGPGGYQLGRFPPAWGEWNDRFRDSLRGFWRGDSVPLGELARRLAGSQDHFAGRRPSRSINFVVAHDGFTLADLVSYAEKHNDANGEQGRDGTDDNRSWNNGVEGPTEDAKIRAARLADQRALLALLLLARGTPMLAMGAAVGQTQGGNNNAYAQDNAIGWLDWANVDAGLLAFTSRLVEIRARHPALRADRFLTGEPGAAGPYPDVDWRRPGGEALDAADWDNPAGETLAMVLAEPDGDRLDRVIVAVHRGRAATALTLPEPRDGFAWRLLADSADPTRRGEIDGEATVIASRSVVALAETSAPGRRSRSVDATTLARLAAAAGIAPKWWEVDGTGHAVSPATQAALLAAMRLPAGTTSEALESLYRLTGERDHRPLPFVVVGTVGQAVRIRLGAEPGAAAPRGWLSVTGDRGVVARLRIGAGPEVELPPLPVGRYQALREDRPDAACALIVAPATCHAPAALADGRRLWGLSAQLYSLRRIGDQGAGDQGIGDFTTLGALGEAGAGRGASILGINPLHALFAGARDRASPYSPSDRRFLDPIYLDLGQVPGADGFRSEGGALSDLAGVDYPAVWALKARALEASFVAAPADADLEAFIAAGGERLERFALFETLSEQHRGPWRDWPGDLADPNSAAARAFADAHRPRLRYHQYLQWLCEGQLAGAARRAAGLALGFCRDLAVGAAPDGAEMWAEAALAASGVSIGAPPDPLGPLGQVWGLPPFDPHRMSADGYRAFGDLLAANMRHAGALRIDHVMGLARQFWVPAGAEGADGAYVAFPLHDLLGVLALESGRAECLVIGEDLGTVPEGLRETLAEAGLLSYRVAPFERDGAAFRPPAAWPRAAWACVATHDLPPLAGWWGGVDIDERLALGLATAAEVADARASRAEDRRSLVAALETEGLVAPGETAEGPLTDELAAAIHGFVAASPAALAVAQVEDLAGERAAVNLPGTDTERPNWRRRIGAPLETLFDSPLALAIVKAMRRA